ncbi:hypothetical protein [Pseudomonas aeruginosa]
MENARNLIERKFEAGLRFQPVADLDELNAAAEDLARVVQAPRRSTPAMGCTRSEAWMTHP